MLHIIRFILTPIAAITGFYTAMITGLVVYGLAETFYPPESFVSGACTAPSWPIVERALIVLFSGLSAATCIIFASIMAPYRKESVRLLTYAIGVFCALLFAVAGDGLWLEFMSAVLIGFATLRLLPRPPTSLANATEPVA